MENTAYSVLTEISQSGRPVALTFQKFGIRSVPNAESLKNAIMTHKQPFIDELYRNLVGNFSASDGSNTDALGKFSDMLGQAVEIVTGVSDVLKAPAPVQPEAPPISEPKKIFGIPVAMVAGIGIIVILTIILIALSKRQ